MYVILDTGDIVRRYSAYDPLFSFYENGIKDVVKEAALVSGKHKPSYRGDFSSDVYWDASLAGRITRDWERAVDIALDHSPQSTRDYLQGQNKMDREVIQIVVEQIEEEVNEMLNFLTDASCYRVEEVDPLTTVEWLGNDLVVDVSSLPEEYDGPP